MNKKQYNKILKQLHTILKNLYPQLTVFERCQITAREALVSPQGSELEKFLLKKSSADPAQTLAEDLYSIK